MHTTRNSCRDTVPCNMALKLSQYFYLLREASWSLLPSLVSLVAGSTVQPENTYSCILKVSGHIVRIQERIRSNQDFGWVLACQVVVIFFRWDLKTPSIKSSEYISQAKKKKDSHCNFNNFSLLVPQPDNFVVVGCVSVSLFSMVYTPPSPQIFFLWGAKFFFTSCSQGMGIFQISWGLSVLGGPNFLSGRGGLGHFLPQSHQ